MSDTAYLIVPVDLTALCVGGGDLTARARRLSAMADFSELPYEKDGHIHPARRPYLSTEVLARSAPFTGEVPFEQGVHLHWALPDGLTRGASNVSGVTFPAVPDRWLLTRLITRTTKAGPQPARLFSWVIESDRLSSINTARPGEPYATAPLAWDQAPNFAYLGLTTPLSNWAENPAAARLSPFTALGYGEPTFASFAPNCNNVFAYTDTFDGVDFDPATDQVGYHVAGWYGDPAADPLNAPGAAPADFRWRASSGATPPTRILCSGVIDSIDWDAAGRWLTDKPKPLSVAIGQSTPEAFSALLAEALRTDPEGQFKDAEPILNALQFGVLSADIRIGSLARLEESVHTAGFDVIRSGPLWTVTQRAPGGEEVGGEILLPPLMATGLNLLNVLQLAHTDMTLRLRSKQAQLFADWSKYLVIEYEPDLVPPSLQPRAQDAQIHLSDQSAQIAELAAEIDAANEQVGAQVRALRAILPAGWDLEPTVTAPRFYSPSNPALVLCGQDAGASPRYGGDGRGSADGFLTCRIDAELVTEATLASGAVAGSAAVTVKAADLPGLATLPPAAPAAQLQALLREALLLCPGLQAQLAVTVRALGGAGNPAVLDLDGTIAVLAESAREFLGGGAPTLINYSGAAPADPYCTAWAGTPWLPVMLQYDVHISPVKALNPETGPDYPSDFISSNFAFDVDAIDLSYTGAPPANPQSFSGSVMLTPSGTALVQNEITRFENNTGVSDPELSETLQLLQDLPLMNQTLGGLNSAMTMRRTALQMPVRDPLAPEILRETFVDPVRLAIGTANNEPAMPTGSFNPIRAGGLDLRKLRLVDAFGRTKDYPTAEVVVSSSLRPPASLGVPFGQAFLPPRLTQPARLLFRWRAASNDMIETNTDPATTPVFGWVAINGLDRALLLYDGDGEPLGEMSLTGDQTKVLWTAAPGGRAARDATVDQVFEGRNPHLADFAKGVFNQGDAVFFRPFLRTVMEAVAFMLPAAYREDAALSVLVSQPLALARASLSLEAAGDLNRDQSWESFEAALDGAAPRDAGLSDVAFPVKLGALTQLNDTLVGYWKEDVTGFTDYRAFYSEAATEADGGVQKPVDDTMRLAPRASSGGGRTITVLMDPRGVVSATTGILPVKQIDIPREQYAPALEGMAVTFQINPVLSGTSAGAPELGEGRPMTLVQPNVPDGDWAWITAQADRWSSVQLSETAPVKATLDYGPQVISEGWLQLRRASAGDDEIR